MRAFGARTTVEVDVKGTTPTSAELGLHDRIAQLGCICCRIEGRFNPVVSIHHCKGRTKPGCHRDVLPLCGPHHQKIEPGVLAIHGDKPSWESRYGKQIDLVVQLMAEIGEPYTRPEDREKPVRKTRAARAKPAAEKAVARPKAACPKRKKLPLTPQQLEWIEGQKQLKKDRAAASKAEYEEANRERIEASKDRAKKYARDVRQRLSNERKAKRKEQKRSKAA
ncbi:Ref family recombination enhancement nuclease [Pseudomonas aeruginosa]|nr:Ref family recombination enhancement nuclease [Pseudomonas aeruginosa]